MEPVALTGDASLGVLWWILGDLVAILAMFFIVLLHRRKRA
jgi:ABC-type polysaccharide/polyol phosphate export permease